jgi:hypothetical protein
VSSLSLQQNLSQLNLTNTSIYAFQFHRTSPQKKNVCSYTGCIKMIGAIWELIIFASMVTRIINTSSTERIIVQVYDTCPQIFDICTLGHTAHIETTVQFLPHFDQHAASCTFSFTKAPRCLKLLLPASNAIGRWRITVEFLPECLLNRNNWFMLHKLQQTKRFLFQSRQYRCVYITDRGRRGEWGKTWTPAVSFHVRNLLLLTFSKP